MADSSFSIKAILSAIDQGFTSGLDAAAAKAKSFGEATESNMKSIGLGMTVAGGAITALGAKSLKSFGDFQQSLNTAAVVAGGTSKDIEGLAEVANKMGADLPLDAQACSDAMIEMARNGASIKDIKQQFPAIAQAATAAGSDIKATAGVVQEAMNIWGSSLESPEQAASILVQTANASNASIEDMQQALATIGGSAGQAGMSLQVTSEAIGLLTNKGFSAAQASMDLNHAILQMMAPSKVAKGAMDDLGISFTDAQGNMKKFPAILSELNQALEGLNPDEKAQKLKAMFGTAGMQAIVPLLDTIKNKTNDSKVSWDAYAKEQEKVSSSTKVSKQALSDQAAEMQKNIGANIEQLGGNWEALRNKAMSSTQQINGSLITNANNVLTWAASSNSGTAQFTRGFIGMMPSIGAATTAVGAFITNAGRIGGVLSGGITAVSNLVKTGVGIAKVATGVASVSEALGTLAESSKIAAAAQGTLNAITSVGTTIKEAYGLITGQVALEEASLSAVMLASPLTWIIVGITAVVVALTLFFTQTKIGRQLWGDFVNWLQGLWNGLVQVAQTVWNAVVQAFNTSVKAVQSAWSGITSFFSGLWNGIVSTARIVWNTLVTIFTPIINAIKSLWNGLVQFILGVWQAFIAGLKPIIAAIKNLFSALGDFFSALWNLIVTVAKTVFNVLVAVFKPIVVAIQATWNGLSAFFRGLWTGIVAVARTVWNTLVAFFRTVVTIIRAVWTPISIFFRTLWNSIVAVVRVVWNTITTVVRTAFTVIKTVITAGMNIVKTVFSAGWNILKTIVSTVWKVITTVISTAINAVAGIIRSITAVIRGDWSGAWNAIKGVVQTIWNGIKSVVQAGISAVQSIVTSIMNAVKGVFSSVWNAIKGVFTSGVQFIKSAMNFDLFAQGQKIMNSLLDGLKSIWENVKSFVGGIGNWIKEHKGPISYDAVLLVPAGNAIMSGFNEGLNSGFENVQDNISSVAGTIADKVNDVMGTAKDIMNKTVLEVPVVDSEKFTNSVNALNGQLNGNYMNKLDISQSNAMYQTNKLLERIADKDTTMVLDDGTLVGKTTTAYNDSLGKNLANKQRWN